MRSMDREQSPAARERPLLNLQNGMRVACARAKKQTLSRAKERTEHSEALSDQAARSFCARFYDAARRNLVPDMTKMPGDVNTLITRWRGGQSRRSLSGPPARDLAMHATGRAACENGSSRNRRSEGGISRSP